MYLWGVIKSVNPECTPSDSKNECRKTVKVFPSLPEVSTGAVALYSIVFPCIFEQPSVQAVQQAEKEETDRIRAKAFKERGLTYTSQGDCEDMY